MIFFISQWKKLIYRKVTEIAQVNTEVPESGLEHRQSGKEPVISTTTSMPGTVNCIKIRVHGTGIWKLSWYCYKMEKVGLAYHQEF